MHFEFLTNSQGVPYIGKSLRDQGAEVADFIYKKLERMEKYGRAGGLAFKVVRKPLWEIKIPYSGDTYRLFCVMYQGKWWVVDGIIKKSGKLKDQDIKRAYKRALKLTS
jgi:phage-related protein